MAASVASAKGAADAGQERSQQKWLLAAPSVEAAADEKAIRKLQRKWLAQHQWRRPQMHPAEK